MFAKIKESSIEEVLISSDCPTLTVSHLRQYIMKCSPTGSITETVRSPIYPATYELLQLGRGRSNRKLLEI